MVESLRIGRAALVGSLAGDGEDTRAELPVAGANARLDERLPLPVLRAFALVTREALEGDDEQALAAGRAQPRIEGVAGALGVRRLEQSHHALRDARGVLGGGVAPPLVDEEEIEIGPVANLPAAELAHPDEREATPGVARAASRVLLAFDLAPLAQREAARLVERRVGERREHVRDLARSELSGEIREAHLEGHAALHAA